MAATSRVAFGAPYSIQPTTTAGFFLFSLDGATDALEYIIQAPAADTITHVGFRYGVRTGTPPTYRVSIQGVGTTGNPDGTIKGGGSPASATFTPPASTAWNSTWQWVALSNSYACSRGEALALVIDYSSGSIDGSNFGSFTTAPSGNGARSAFPYAIENAAGVRARHVGQAAWGMKSGTASYGVPFQAATVTAFSTNTEYALQFTLPDAAGGSYQVMGVRANITTPAAAKSFDLRLYEGTTLLQTATFDTDTLRANAFPGSLIELYFANTTLATLTCGTTYYAAFAPTDASNNIALLVWTAAAAQDAAAWGGDGNWCLATRAGGAWTSDTLSRPAMELLLADLSEPTPPVARALIATRASTY
jgi:hypothetical protein